MFKKVEFNLSEKTINLLEILMKKTNRNKNDLVEEALSNFFEEMKEIILET